MNTDGAILTLLADLQATVVAQRQRIVALEAQLAGLDPNRTPPAQPPSVQNC